MVGDNLREARLAKGLTQGQLADRLGIDRNTVNRIENGRGEPSIGTLRAWATECGVSTDSLLEIDESAMPPSADQPGDEVNPVEPAA